MSASCRFGVAQQQDRQSHSWMEAVEMSGICWEVVSENNPEIVLLDVIRPTSGAAQARWGPGFVPFFKFFVCFFTCDLGFWSHLLNFPGTEMIFPLSQTCMWFTSFDVLKYETLAIGERLLKAWLVADVTHDSDWQVPKSCVPPDPPSGSKNN